MIQRQADKVAICIMTIIIVLAGCAASGDKKVELPESVSIESIELQFMDDSGTSSGAVSIDNEEKDAIIELIQTTCKYRSESVYDNPQETPYISVNIHAKTEEYGQPMKNCTIESILMLKGEKPDLQLKTLRTTIYQKSAV